MEYKSPLDKLITILRTLALLGGVGCLLAFWVISDNVWHEIAWATYGAALFLFVIATKE